MLSCNVTYSQVPTTSTVPKAESPSHLTSCHGPLRSLACTQPLEPWIKLWHHNPLLVTDISPLSLEPSSQLCTPGLLPGSWHDAAGPKSRPGTSIPLELRDSRAYSKPPEKQSCPIFWASWLGVCYVDVRPRRKHLPGGASSSCLGPYSSGLAHPVDPATNNQTWIAFHAGVGQI